MSLSISGTVANHVSNTIEYSHDNREGANIFDPWATKCNILGAQFVPQSLVNYRAISRPLGTFASVPSGYSLVSYKQVFRQSSQFDRLQHASHDFFAF